jgi:DNA-directed RNA polymerase specialized sigma24 family protein
MKEEVIFYERANVVLVPLDEAINEDKSYCLDDSPRVNDVLEFLSGLPLRDQVFMLCQLLTVSGFSEEEISKILKVDYQTYRNRLWSVRKNWKKDNKRL